MDVFLHRPAGFITFCFEYKSLLFQEWYLPHIHYGHPHYFLHGKGTKTGFLTDELMITHNNFLLHSALQNVESLYNKYGSFIMKTRRCFLEKNEASLKWIWCFVLEKRKIRLKTSKAEALEVVEMAIGWWNIAKLH